MKTKTRFHKLTAWLLTLAMLMTFIPNFMLTTFAAGTDTGKAIQLVDSGTAANISGGQASSIYFGTYQQSSLGNTEPTEGAQGVGWMKSDTATKNGQGPYYKIEPIKWHVLSNADRKLFLLSDQTLDTFNYHDKDVSVTWETSTMRSWLNGYAASFNTGGDSGIDYTSDNFLNTAFSAKDQTAIADTTVVNVDNSVYQTEGGNNTTDKVFLLSIAEARNTSYFANDNSRIGINTDYAAGGGETGEVSADGGVGLGAMWWLRSPGNNNGNAATVSGLDGACFSNGRLVSNSSIDVRPAFNLNLNSVLFTSAANNEGHISFGAPIPDYSDSEWKVTLKDDNDFSTGASVTGTTKFAEGYSATELTINHAALDTFTDAGYTNVTATLTDASGKLIYYGSINDVVLATSSTIIIPAGLAVGDYTLSVYGEDQNDAKCTDYATGTPYTTTITVCDHSGNTNEATDNGDGTHSFICTVCKVTVTEAHTPDETIGQTCKGYQCEDCGAWYGEADLSAHVFASDGKTCKYCRQTIVAKVTRDGVVSYYTAIEDVTAGEEDSTNVLTVLADTTLTESVNLGFMSLERVGDVTITVPEEYSLKVTGKSGEENTVNWIGSMGYSATARMDRRIVAYEALPEDLSVTYVLLRDVTMENLKIRDGAYNGYLIVTEGVTLTVTDTMAVECTGGQTEIRGTLILGENAAMTNGDKITVAGMLVLGKNATITNSSTICLDNAEVYTTVHHIPTGITGGSVEVNGVTYTYVSEGNTDETDFAPYWTCYGEHAGDLTEATCVSRVNCDYCGDPFGSFGGHSCNIETGCCVYCDEDVAVASVTDGTTTLYANYGAQLEEIIGIFLEVESIRNITVVLPDGELLDHVGNGVKTAVHGEQQTVHLTIQGVTTIPADSELVALAQLGSLSLPDVTYIEAGALKETKLQTLALTAEDTITLEEGFMDTDRIGQVALVLCCNKASSVTDGVTWQNFTFKSITFTEHDYVNSVCRFCNAVCVHNSQDTTATDNGDGTHKRICGECGHVVPSEIHTLTYTANGNVITSVCTANCGNSGTATISAEDTTYNGAGQKTATVTYSEGWTGGELTVSYENNKNAGTATASITEGGVTASVDFTIAKAQAVISVESPIVKTYGEAWELPTATTNFGTVTGDKTVAEMSNAGEYTVTYTVAGDDNFNGATKTVNVTINPKPVTGATVGAFAELTYTGEAQAPSATVTIDGLTVTGTWSDVTNVADTTTFTANGNFTGTIADVDVGMKKATPMFAPESVWTASLPVGKALSQAYTSFAELLGVDGNPIAGSYEWKAPDKVISDKGDYTEKVVFTPEDTNYAPIELDAAVSCYIPQMGGLSAGGDKGTSGKDNLGTPSNDKADEGDKTDEKEEEAIPPSDDADKSENTFTDVAPAAWYGDAVEWMNKKGYMSGTGNGKFSPNLPTTRGMVVTVLWRIAGKPAPQGECTFQDVKAGSYYEDAITWAQENGVVTGHSDTVFAPDELITREQLATIIHRNEKRLGNDVSHFNDLEHFVDDHHVSDWALEAKQWAVGAGIISGTSATTLHPKKEATRAETAAILYRMNNK